MYDFSNLRVLSRSLSGFWSLSAFLKLQQVNPRVSAISLPLIDSVEYSTHCHSHSFHCFFASFVSCSLPPLLPVLSPGVTNYEIRVTAWYKPMLLTASPPSYTSRSASSVEERDGRWYSCPWLLSLLHFRRDAFSIQLLLTYSAIHLPGIH